MIRLPLLLVVTMAISPASAEVRSNGESRLEVVGEATSACVVRAPSSATGNNANFGATSAASGEVTIGQMVDAETAQSRGARISLNLPVICNSAHRLVVRSGTGGLRRDGALAEQSQGVFIELVPYQLRASWGGVEAGGLSTDGRTFAIDMARGNAGEASILIDVPAGGSPLVAGRYTDQIIVEFQVAN
jgi:hypothetical protein